MWKKHDFWEIICYVEKGSIMLHLEEECCVLDTHDLLLIPPNRIHSYFSEVGNQNGAFVICFEISSKAIKSLGEVRLSLDAV